jgi:hypothetical protein
MKLSKLYSNRPDIFEPIDFVTGLNVVLAEIRVPENRKKDTSAARFLFSRQQGQGLFPLQALRSLQGLCVFLGDRAGRCLIRNGETWS